MKGKIFIITAVAGLIITTISCQKNVAPGLSGTLRGKSYDSAAFDYLYIEAIKEKLMGNPGEALKNFEQCLKMTPNNDAIYYQMAQILLNGGDINNGIKYARKAVELNPENLWYLRMIAGTYYQINNLDSAVYFYEQAVKKYPEREELLMTLGNLYSENKKYEKAGEIFGKLDEKYGINEKSTVANIRNMMQGGNYDQALVLALELNEKYPDEILYSGLLAEIYKGKGDKRRAMEVYNVLIERNPDSPETQLSLCDFLLKEKKYDELMELSGKVIMNEKISRENKIGMFAQIIENDDIIKEKKNEVLLSLMVLEAAYPDDGIILLLRPDLYQKSGDLKSAAGILEEIIRKTPDNYYAWEKLLLIYLEAEDYKNLEKIGEQCALRFNRSFIAKMLYAAGATENKNYETALEEVRKAEILAGDNEEMLLQVMSTRADVYYRMGEYEKAFGIFDEAIKTNKNDMTLLNNYAYYLAEQNLRLKEAEKMSKMVIEKERTNYTFLDTYAWVLYKRGKLKEAEKIMEEIIEKSEKKDAEYYEHMGYIKMKRKKCKEAIESWKNALKLDSSKVELMDEIKRCGEE